MTCIVLKDNTKPPCIQFPARQITMLQVLAEVGHLVFKKTPKRFLQRNKLHASGLRLGTRVSQAGAVLCKCSCPGSELQPQTRCHVAFKVKPKASLCHPADMLRHTRNSCLQACPAPSRRLTWLGRCSTPCGWLGSVC